MKKLTYSIVIAPFLALFFISVHVFFILSSSYDGPDRRFQIKPGEGFSSINYRLRKEGLIDNARVFHYYAKLTGSMTKFQAGTYEIKKGNSMMDIMSTLTEGAPILNSITLPEGKNIYEMAQILVEKEIIEKAEEFIEAAKSEEIMNEFGLEGAPSLEGYLYPETYKFAPSTPAKMIVKAMLEQYKRATKEIELKYPGMSAHEIITLASIVEKETGAPQERNTIAGVYHNRLKKKMRLQADPTTIYGIYHRDGKFDGNLRKKDLLTKTEYNTYKMSGLPLGPICNPSKAAIEATLNPEEHNYLYFVSKNDGTHIFTSTYKEHNKAVDFWQKTRRNRQGKSWRDLKKKKK
jgi:UPF0755 protein